MGDAAPATGSGHLPRRDRFRQALRHAKAHLRRRALELVGFLVVVYAVLKLVPALEQALHALEHASWKWILAANAGAHRFTP